MINNYWWSSDKEERKVSIDVVEQCEYVERQGSLGFRKLYGFNITLLGKHCWNFMQNPNALVSRVYKARHFPDTYLMRSSQGEGSSFIWSRI